MNRPPQNTFEQAGQSDRSLTHELLAALNEFPGVGMTSGELAIELGIESLSERNKVTATLSKLYRKRRIDRKGDGYRYEYFVSEEGQHAAD